MGNVKDLLERYAYSVHQFYSQGENKKLLMILEVAVLEEAEQKAHLTTSRKVIIRNVRNVLGRLQSSIIEFSQSS